MKIKIFLGDLEHTWEKVGVWTFPLNVACVGAYTKKQFANEIEVRLFKRPELLIDAIKTEKPGVVGLSYYCWQIQLNKRVFEVTKAYSPDTLTVGGGPEFTTLNANEEGAKRFFAMQKECDAFVLNQGEMGFSELIKEFFACNLNINKLRNKTIPGCLINNLDSCQNVQIGPLLEEIKHLDEIPSPYLTGLLDPFFEEPFAPILETNRCCPYRCTFCAWGIGTKKLSRYSDERIFEEIEYVSQRCKKTKGLYIADANFGIIERDVTIAKKLYECSKHHGYPGNVMVNWNKTRPDLLLNAACEFRGLAGVGASMQSFHEPTLQAIKRTNHSWETIVEIATKVQDNNLHLFSELILGLPLETKESHIKANKKLMDLGGEIFNYNLHLLPGTELDTEESRKKYFRHAAWRLYDMSFGIYEGKKVFEGEEVAIETSTMPKEELRSFRFIHFLTQFMWSREWYYDFLHLFKQTSLHPLDVIIKIAEAFKGDAGEMGEIYRDFCKDHELELFDSREDLCEFWSREENFERLRSGNYGKLNYMYTYIILLEHYEAFNNFLYKITEELAPKMKLNNRDLFLRQCKEVLRFTKNLKIGLTGGQALVDSKTESFEFDFLSWRKGKYQDVLKASGNDSKFEYELYLPESQKALLTTHFSQFDSHSLNLSLRKLSEGIAAEHFFYKVRSRKHLPTQEMRGLVEKI